MAKNLYIFALLLIILAPSTCKSLEIKNQDSLALVGMATASCDGTSITIDITLSSGVFAASAENIKA